MQKYQYNVVKIAKIVDGDTIDVIVDLGFAISTRIRVRLAGIDTPEIFTGDVEEKERGFRAKNWLVNRLDGAKDPITLRSEKYTKDKYVRCIGRLFLGDIDINQQMLDEGVAVPMGY